MTMTVQKTTESMVERVARAIYESRYGEWESLHSRQRYLDMARAAISTMREPTRPMWAHAGTMFVNCQGRQLHHDRACGLVWDAMIAAALEPELADA